MRLIIGGRAQGKLDYAKRAYALADADIAQSLTAFSARAVYALHELIAQSMKDGKDPEAQLEALLAKNPNVIIICDELGCGIVPVDAFERAWRERTGRICCELARRAESVERVLAGVAMKIK